MPILDSLPVSLAKYSCTGIVFGIASTQDRIPVRPAQWWLPDGRYRKVW